MYAPARERFFPNGRNILVYFNPELYVLFHICRTPSGKWPLLVKHASSSLHNLTKLLDLESEHIVFSSQVVNYIDT